MLEALDTALAPAEMALELRAKRQQVIASNIANADTPAYRAVDLDFADALRRARSTTSTGPGALGASTLARTAPGHLPAKSTASALGALIEERPSAQPSVDGNTVDTDAEHARFAENAIRYEAAFRVLNGKIRTLLSALQG
jgi:flagellar basal-body rod protein FlgB